MDKFFLKLIQSQLGGLESIKDSLKLSNEVSKLYRGGVVSEVLKQQAVMGQAIPDLSAVQSQIGGVEKIIKQQKGINGAMSGISVMQKLFNVTNRQFLDSSGIAAIFAQTQMGFADHSFADFGFAGAKYAELLPSITKLNIQVQNASHIADLDYSDVDSISDGDKGLSEEAESRLIKVVPEKVLEELRKVEFAPITLLDRVFKDPDAMYALGSREFEGFVARLVDQLGFEDVELTPRSNDGGRDVLATYIVHGLPILFAFECKKYKPENHVGLDLARALLGTISSKETRASKGVLVTTSFFTSGTKKYLVEEPNLDGKDFNGVVDWLHEYNEHKHRD